MKSKEVTIGDKKFIVKELLAIDVDTLDYSTPEKIKESSKKELMFATGLTEDEYKVLTFNERRVLRDEVNAINGLIQVKTSDSNFSKESN
jgi:aminoglycoside phosphotransferase family enzyme